MNSVDQIPQTPSPVRVKRGAIDAEMERRTLDISFSADGTKLAACNTIGQTWVVCLSTGKILHSMRGHKKARVSTCAISPGGGFVASGGSDGRVALWDCRQGSPAYLLGGPDKIPQHKDIKVNGISYGVSNVEISPDGRYLASAGQDGVVLIYQLANGAAVDDLPLAEHVEPKQWLRLPFGDPEEEQSHMALAHAAMHFVGFSMDGSLCAACGAYGRFALVEVDSEKVHDFFLGSEDEAFLHVAFDNVGGLGPPENIAVTSTLVSSNPLQVVEGGSP